VKICQPKEKENTASQCLMALSFFENNPKKIGTMKHVWVI
jgi:hypothetical protein